MAVNLKVLGQVATDATTLTTLYTAPSNTQAVVSSITICNRGGASTTFRIAVRVAGEALASKQYLYYDQAISANETFIATIGLTLDETDVLSVYAGNANLSFQAFGQENS